MAYVFKNAQGNIVGNSSENLGDGWEFIEGNAKEYLDYLENSLAENAPFRESDIQLARVLEDLISILIDRGMLRFTDFPPAAQKRLNYRQSMRKKNRLSGIVDESRDFFTSLL
ncbi:MAG: hypothetical protein Q7T42_04990 [Methylotenera sp.]|uniref:hypothetical protein n=1 Tax=Methylotenera sp. TaxID=2051956 RepID=UPI0027263ADD|nr:hypothetical protein [Methylotenera sp.]MDO9205191.1 hypothetical protein [Methylotenera sp.]MDO9393315.1 hypothetical protein [Methylotenera sp.]MDP1521729.1 hypothetical protein [Methylotenera sp.]MDP2230164.1 hypothetical protein [Methylotenera sp.]MDP3141823.1 hypothetical protein [Methylotenera sp.]